MGPGLYVRMLELVHYCEVQLVVEVVVVVVVFVYIYIYIYIYVAAQHFACLVDVPRLRRQGCMLELVHYCEVQLVVVVVVVVVVLVYIYVYIYIYVAAQHFHVW